MHNNSSMNVYTWIVYTSEQSDIFVKNARSHAQHRCKHSERETIADAAIGMATRWHLIRRIRRTHIPHVVELLQTTTILGKLFARPARLLGKWNSKIVSVIFGKFVLEFEWFMRVGDARRFDAGSAASQHQTVVRPISDRSEWKINARIFLLFMVYCNLIETSIVRIGC